VAQVRDNFPQKVSSIPKKHAVVLEFEFSVAEITGNIIS